jgi:hypothetical protein
MRIKLITILLITLLINISCTSLKINSAKRNIVYPGVPSGNTLMKYELIINSQTQFSINRISLKDETIDVYSVQDINTQVFMDIKKNLFEPGEYKLSFSSKFISKNQEDNKITIEFKIRGKTKIISVLPKEMPPVRRR